MPSAIRRSPAAWHFLSSVHAPPPQVADVEWLHARIFDALGHWDTGEVFPNFLGYADTAPERVSAAYAPDDYQRLRALKAGYDPRNLLRVNFNSTPLKPSEEGALRGDAPTER